MYWFRDSRVLTIHDGTTVAGVAPHAVGFIGSTAPTDTFPGMIWLDSTSNQIALRVRTAADDAWDTLSLIDGTVNIQGGISAAGAFTIAAEIGSIPFTQFNLTETDADGGRSSSMIGGGETAAGTQHYLAEISVEHDGAGADQRARVVFTLNDGGDGFAPSVEALRVLPEGLDVPAAVWASGLDRRFEAMLSSNRTISSGGTTLVWSGSPDFEDAGFSQADTDTAVQVAEVGRYEAAVEATLDCSTSSSNVWGEVDMWLELDDGQGGGYVEITGSRRAQQMRYQSGQATRETVSLSRTFTVSEVDSKVRVRSQVIISAGTFVVVAEAANTMFRVKRLPA